MKMLLQSLRALYTAQGGARSIPNYIEALARATRVSGMFEYGFRSELHFADVQIQITLVRMQIPTKRKKLRKMSIWTSQQKRINGKRNWRGFVGIHHRSQISKPPQDGRSKIDFEIYLISQEDHVSCCVNSFL
jgi:hypothetical protein